MVSAYATDRNLDLRKYSPYHYRMTDGGFTILDMWPTGKYHVLKTDYQGMGIENAVERGYEKGSLPIHTLTEFLDGLFFGDGALINE